jgi:hypothetical protein
VVAEDGSDAAVEAVVVVAGACRWLAELAVEAILRLLQPGAPAGRPRTAGQPPKVSKRPMAPTMATAWARPTFESTAAA